MDYSALAQELFEIQLEMFRRSEHRPVEDLSRGEFFALGYLSHHGGSAAPCEIGAARGISSARIAAILNQLEAKGLIRRQRDPQDKRKTQAYITPDGCEQVAVQQRQVLGQLEEMLRSLGETDGSAYVRIQKRILEHCIATGEIKC